MAAAAAEILAPERLVQRAAVAADAAAAKSAASSPPMIMTPPRARCAIWRPQPAPILPSFTRLAKALGYSGWDELRAALTEARRPDASRAILGPQPGAGAAVPTPTSSLVADKLEAEAAGLARISPGSVAGAAKALHAARRIWIAGFRSCRSVAELLNYQLRLFRPDDGATGRRLRPRGSRSRRLPVRRRGRRDRLCALFHARACCRRARRIESGATLIAIADTVTAPMAEGADHLLLFEAASSPGFFPSLTGAIAIAQSLAAVTFVLGGAGGQAAARGNRSSPRRDVAICCRERLSAMAARNSRVLHRSLRETPAEGHRRRRRLADCRGRPADSRCAPAAPPSPVSAISIRACSRRWRGRPRSLPMPTPASSRRSRRKRWPIDWSATSPAGSPTPISSAADRKRSRPASSWRGNISSRRGQPQRQRFIARRQSYHGNTLGALAAGGNAWRREPYAPLLSPAFSHVTPAFAYHEKRDDESEAEFVARLAAELEAEFQRLGPDTVAAFIAEPVVGATAGCVPAPEGYFRAVREICNRHGALLILDEVMCGMGRTGTLHAWEQEGIAPDIQAIAKGLGRRLPADRRDARERAHHRHHPATARAHSSTDTPISRIRWPARRRWRCSGSSTRSICSTGSRSSAAISSGA